MPDILDTGYYKLKIRIKPKISLRCGYCGAVLRGWLLDAIYRNKGLKEYFFNRKSQTLPFFFYPEQANGGIFLTVIFLKAEYSRMRELVNAVAKSGSSFRKEISVEGVVLEEERFAEIPLTNPLTVEFVTPLAMETESSINFSPGFNEIVKAGVRSLNRYLKEYYQEFYPFNISKRFRAISSNIEGLDAQIVKENYVNNHGKKIILQGITGRAVYRLEGDIPEEELSRILSILDVIQIGKHISYGMGKLRIVRTDSEILKKQRR